MEDKLPTLQTAATNFVKRLKPNDIAQVIDFDSRVEIRQGFTGNQAELEAAIQQTDAGGSTSLHNAIYIALKELRKVKAGERRGRPPPGARSSSPTAKTRRAWSRSTRCSISPSARETAIYTIALRGTDTQAKGFREAEFVMRTLAQETGGRAFFPAKIEDLNGVYAQIADELASQYTLGYTSKNPRRDGAWRRIVVQVTRAERHAAHQEGLLRPDSPLNLLPLVLYAAAGVVYAIHFARAAAGRRPHGHDAAAARRRSSTPSSSACRRWRCGTCRSRTASRAISTFVWLLALSYLYLELTTDERAMGVFILPIVVGLQIIPALYPGIENARSRCSTVRGSGCTSRRCCSRTPASRWPACSA